MEQLMDHNIVDTNYTIYRDALAAVLVEKLAEPGAKPRRKRQRKRRTPGTVTETEAEPVAEPVTEPVADPVTEACLIEPEAPDGANDLADFADYLARETFDLLPAELQTLAHHVWVADAALRQKYSSCDDDDDDKNKTKTPMPLTAPLTAPQVTDLLPGLDPSAAADSMHAYGLTSEGGRCAADIVAPALSAYLAAVTEAPPPPRSTRDQAAGCEICGRDWLVLSYHHLIPRFVHAKAVKRGWHRADELQNVAWLCGACHRQVHKFASHEDLARHYYTVERLLAEPEMQRYAAWASRLRWKKR